MPMALAMLVPVFVIGVMVAVKRGASMRKGWSLIVALMAVFTVSSVIAVETGEDEEEVVEDVVDHDIIHEHEEAGERLRNLAVLTFALSMVGLANGKVGAAFRGVSAGMVFVLAVAAYGVGKSGGELVYDHGAANAYMETPAGPSPSTIAEPEHEDDDSDD
jgi:hypothetical protein